MDTLGSAVSRAIAPKPVEAASNTATGAPASPRKLEETQAKAASAVKRASDKVVGAVKSVGVMVEIANRRSLRNGPKQTIFWIVLSRREATSHS